MTELHVTEPPETTIEEPEGSLEMLEDSGAQDVARRYPNCLAAWAALGEVAMSGRRHVEAYAYFRVGYHRGLDRLRQSGWRGAGRVPWSHPGNRGFLRALVGLSRAAEAIGESNEAERCRDFAARLAPDMPST